MEIIVYTCESERENLEQLSEVLPVTTELTGYCEDYNNKVIVRLGRSNRLPSRRSGRPTDFKNVINPSANIRANCNKMNSSLIMSKVVKTPKIFNEGYVPEGLTVVYRPIRHLAAGLDFKLATGAFKIQPEMYAVELIKNVEEFRVWRAGNYLKMAQRYTPYPERWAKNGQVFSEDYPCRSNFPYVQKKIIPDILQEQVIKASNLLGLECCACDILKRGNEYYFLECNSCPSVDVGSLALFFKEGILDYINKKFGATKETVNSFSDFFNTRVKV